MFELRIAIPVIQEVIKSYAAVGDHIKLLLAQIRQKTEGPSFFSFLLFLLRSSPIFGPYSLFSI